MRWAFLRKVDPASAPAADARLAWHAAARAVLAAVPEALERAGLHDLEAGARHDGLLDRITYARRAGHVQGARRNVRHPSARLRVTSLRLLQVVVREGRVPQREAHRVFPRLLE